MKTYTIILLAVIFSSCGSTDISYDYDETIDFEQYRFFSAYPEMSTGLNPFDEERILKSIRAELVEKGFSASEQPDFYINIYTEQFREQNRNNVGIGVGGGGGNVGVGISGGFPIGGQDTYMRIIVDFIDVKNDALIWQAIIESKFNQNASPEEQQAQFHKIIGEALDEFPPE